MIIVLVFEVEYIQCLMREETKYLKLNGALPDELKVTKVFKEYFT